MKNYLYSITIEVLRRIVAILLPEKQDEFEQVFNQAENEFMQTAPPDSTQADAQAHAINAYRAVAANEIVNFVSVLSFDEQLKLYEKDVSIADLLMTDTTFATILKVKNYLDEQKSALENTNQSAKESLERLFEEGTNGIKSLVRTEKETFTEFSQTAEKNVRKLAGDAETHANNAYTSAGESANSAGAAKQSADDAEGWKKLAEKSAEDAAKLAAKPVFWQRLGVILFSALFIVLIAIISVGGFSGTGKASQSDYKALQQQVNDLQEQINNLPEQLPAPTVDQPVDENVGNEEEEEVVPQPDPPKPKPAPVKGHNTDGPPED